MKKELRLTILSQVTNSSTATWMDYKERRERAASYGMSLMFYALVLQQSDPRTCYSLSRTPVFIFLYETPPPSPRVLLPVGDGRDITEMWTHWDDVTELSKAGRGAEIIVRWW